LNNFNITKEEVLEFKKRYKLEEKPIIYLGNCQKAKGVVDSYKALKDLDVYLVTSSRRQVNVPTLNFDVDYRDYLRLLKASSIAVTMDKFNTGWNMTAQEAMLCKTPVIGSGMGGTRELYEGANQIICQDFKNLKEKVEYLLSHPEVRKKMGEDGYNYSKQFTLERFQNEWLDLIKKIIN
jgi:glycosyltransferase involved in cell wall biosynthesis